MAGVVSFGRTIGDITRALSDRVSDGYAAVADTLAALVRTACERAATNASAVRAATGGLADTARTTLFSVFDRVLGRGSEPAQASERPTDMQGAPPPVQG